MQCSKWSWSGDRMVWVWLHPVSGSLGREISGTVSGHPPLILGTPTNSDTPGLHGWGINRTVCGEISNKAHFTFQCFRRRKYSSSEIIIWQKYYSVTAGHKSCWRSAPPPSCHSIFLYSQILTSPLRYSWAQTQGWLYIDMISSSKDWQK